MENKNMDPTTRLGRNDDIIFSVIDGEVVMMSIENGEYYGINPVGSRIWELLENPKQIDEILRRLQEEYYVLEEQCEDDVISFIGKLLDLEILVVHG